MTEDTPEMLTAKLVLEAMKAPIAAAIELQFALIGHLYDKGQIDPQAIVSLLQGRLDTLSKEPGSEGLCALIVGQINWLDRIGTGLKHLERRE